MEKLGRILEHSPNSILVQKTYSYEDPHDDPDYKEPSLEEKRADWLLKYAGVFSLDNTFDKLKKVKGQEKMVAAFQELITGTEWFMLMVYGVTGNGKTHCCEATVIALYDKGIKCQRLKWSDIIRSFKASFNNKLDMPYEEKFNQIRARKYLIIDDVGMGSTGGNWEWGELEDIVDYRLEHGLFTIITTNLDLKDIPERIVSRFRDKRKAKLVWNEAPDQRPKMEASSHEQ